MCAYSLDHITPSRLGVVARIQRQLQMLGPRGPRLSLYDTSWTFRLKTLATSQFSKNTDRPQRPPASNLVCAQFIQSSPCGMVGLGGLEPPTSPLSGVRSNHLSYRPKSLPRWWSQSGSNRRPPACKAGALPAELWPLGFCKLQNGTRPRQSNDRPEL